ncbi:MAG: transposase [Pleurocapsa sp.]
MKSKQYRRGGHSVTLIYAHLVFVTKYRKKVFTAEHLEYLKDVCRVVATKMDFRIVRLNGENKFTWWALSAFFDQPINANNCASVRVGIPSFSALANLEPASSPTTK